MPVDVSATTASIGGYPLQIDFRLVQARIFGVGLQLLDFADADQRQCLVLRAVWIGQDCLKLLKRFPPGIRQVDCAGGTR